MSSKNPNHAAATLPLLNDGPRTATLEKPSAADPTPPAAPPGSAQAAGAPAGIWKMVNPDLAGNNRSTEIATKFARTSPAPVAFGAVESQLRTAIGEKVAAGFAKLSNEIEVANKASARVREAEGTLAQLQRDRAETIEVGGPELGERVAAADRAIEAARRDRDDFAAQAKALEPLIRDTHQALRAAVGREIGSIKNAVLQKTVDARAALEKAIADKIGPELDEWVRLKRAQADLGIWGRERAHVLLDGLMLERRLALPAPTEQPAPPTVLPAGVTPPPGLYGGTHGAGGAWG